MKRPVGLPLSRKALYLLFQGGPGDVLRSEPDTPVPRIARVADVQYKKNNHSYGQGSLQTSQREVLQRQHQRTTIVDIEKPFVRCCRDNNKPFPVIPQSKRPRANGSHEHGLTVPAVNKIRLFIVPLAHPLVPPVSKHNGAAANIRPSAAVSARALIRGALCHHGGEYPHRTGSSFSWSLLSLSNSIRVPGATL